MDKALPWVKWEWLKVLLLWSICQTSSLAFAKPALQLKAKPAKNSNCTVWVQLVESALACVVSDKKGKKRETGNHERGVSLPSCSVLVSRASWFQWARELWTARAVFVCLRIWHLNRFNWARFILRHKKTQVLSTQGRFDAILAAIGDFAVLLQRPGYELGVLCIVNIAHAILAAVWTERNPCLYIL